MGSYRDLEKGTAPAAPKQGGTYRQMDLASAPTPKRKPTVVDDVAGGMHTLVRAVPFLDEVNDGLYAWGKTAGQLLTGREHLDPKDVRGSSKALVRKNYDTQRAIGKASSEDFAARRPVTGALTTGLGGALTAVPALLTGGATLAPSVAPKVAPAVAKGLMGAISKVTPQVVKTLSPAVAKGATVGGLSGAITGLADEGSVDERLHDMNAAAIPSAVLGGLIPLGAAAASGSVNAVGRLMQPAERRAQAQAGRVLASRAPHVVDMPDAPPGDITLPFERMGPGGETVARAVASVPGPGQTMAREALVTRGQGARQRILASVQRELGDDGGNFHPTREALDQRRLNDAEPLYREAFDVEAPVTDALTRLSARPSIRDAMQRGSRLAREEGEDPLALGLFHMENPADWATEFAPTGAKIAEAERVAGFARPPRRPTQGPSLSKFIADNGGILDEGGELSAMDGGSWHRGKAYQRGLIGEGGSADTWAERAWEAGYFPQYRDRPTIREFLDALSDDVSGRRKVFARDIDTRAADRFRRAEEADEMIYRGGDPSDLPDEADYMGRPEPLNEPVYGEAPTFKAWDYVKRGLDDLLESHRDPVTGKLERTDQVRLIEKTRRELRGHLREINPKYGEALDAYSGPSHQMHALALGRRMVEGKMDVEDIEAGLGRMSADELDSLRLGIARGLSDAFRGKNPQVAFRRFMSDELIQDRLRAGFGNDQSYGRFMQDIASEFEAQLSRNRILTGSRTTPLAEDISAVNQAADDGGLINGALKVAGDSRPLRHQAFGWAVTKLQQAKQAGTGLNNPEVSRLLGQALFRAGDPRELLEAMVQQRIIQPEELEAILPYLAVGGGQTTAQAIP